MRKLLFILVVFSCLTVNGQRISGQYATVISTRANLRGTPSASGAVIDQVYKNQIFKVLDVRLPWYLVQTTNYVGWLHGDTIRIGTITPEPSRQTPRIPSGRPSPDVPGLQVPDPDTVQPEWLETDDDAGYDIAISSYDNVFLRSRPPDTVSLGEPLPAPIKRASKGDQFVVLSRSKTRNWVNVIDLKSGKEGWIYVSHVKIYYTKAPKVSAPQFQERRTDSYRSPEINIKNDTSETLNLRIGENRYLIEPYTSTTITLTSGSYKFYAWVPNAYPLIGEKYWANGSGYSWTFFIKRTNY